LSVGESGAQREISEELRKTRLLPKILSLLTSSPTVPRDSKNHFLGFLFPRLGLH
jgi:hypothetical protein